MVGKQKNDEDTEQESLINWARVESIAGTGYRILDYLLAIPNGGKRNVREAARLKRQGVKAGVSDLFFAYPVGNYHGLWIEMKKRRDQFKRPSDIKRAASDSQIEWIVQMRDQGYAAEVCFGWIEAMELIVEYLQGKYDGE